MPATRNRSRHFCPLPLSTGVTKNTQCSSTEWNNALLTRRREGRARSASGVGLVPCRRRVSSCGQCMAGCLPLLWCSKKTCPLPGEGTYNSGVGRVLYDAHTWSKNKRPFFELKQGKIFPPKAVSPTQALWALSLLVRECSKPKAHS